MLVVIPTLGGEILVLFGLGSGIPRLITVESASTKNFITPGDGRI
jgi:hypothetical protein